MKYLKTYNESLKISNELSDLKNKFDSDRKIILDKYTLLIDDCILALKDEFLYSSDNAIGYGVTGQIYNFYYNFTIDNVESYKIIIPTVIHKLNDIDAEFNILTNIKNGNLIIHKFPEAKILTTDTKYIDSILKDITNADHFKTSKELIEVNIKIS